MNQDTTRGSTQASPGTALTSREMLERLCKLDRELAHFIELLMQLEEAHPEVAYCLEYLLCIPEKQRHTAQVGAKCATLAWSAK